MKDGRPELVDLVLTADWEAMLIYCGNSPASSLNGRGDSLPTSTSCKQPYVGRLWMWYALTEQDKGIDMSKTKTFALSNRGCKTALLVEQRTSEDVIQLLLRDPNGNEIAQIVVKWQAGAVWLDGWSHENITARDETPDVETTLYWEDQGEHA